MRPYIIILYLISCVLVGAIGDGLWDEGMALTGHGLEALEVLLLVSGPFIFGLERRNCIPYLIALIAFRIALFDYTYNLVAGLPWDFVGHTSWWDIIISKYYPKGLIWGRAIFFILGVALPIREIGSHRNKTIS
jgi:hypothetical protein